jgi:ankyrin repeat protein
LVGATALTIMAAGCGNTEPDEKQASSAPEAIQAPTPKVPAESPTPPKAKPAANDAAKKGLAATAPPSKKPQASGIPGTPEPSRINTANNAAVASPIRFQPDPLDLGEMTADVAKTGTVTIVNTSDEPVTITKAVPGCGCTTLGWPKEPIAAGASADIDITLKPGPKQGVTLRKRVTFQLDGFPSQVLQVQGKVAEYVAVKPDIVPARVEEEPLSEEIVLTSVDGTPFVITGANPAVVTELSTEPALVQTVQMDWAAWEEAGRPVKIAFQLDHPKSAQVSTLVKRRSLNARTPNAPNVTTPPSPQINDLSGAARSGDLTRVKLLIANGTDANTADTNGGRTPLHWAVKGNHIEVVRYLLESGADIDRGERAGKTALDFAAESGQIEMTQLLVDSGADVNKRDLIGGNSALWAAGLGTPETLEILVKANADIEVKDINGLTPLAWAAQTGSTKSMEILIEAGAKVNVVDMLNGESILMRAARSGKVESVQLLLANNADTGIQTKMGASTLQIASEYGNADIVKILVDSGLDPKAKDARGWNALDYANNRVDDSRFAVIEYLGPLVDEKDPAN